MWRGRAVVRGCPPDATSERLRRAQADRATLSHLVQMKSAGCSLPRWLIGCSVGVTHRLELSRLCSSYQNSAAKEPDARAETSQVMPRCSPPITAESRLRCSGIGAIPATLRLLCRIEARRSRRRKVAQDRHGQISRSLVQDRVTSHYLTDRARAAARAIASSLGAEGGSARLATLRPSELPQRHRAAVLARVLV